MTSPLPPNPAYARETQLELLRTGESFDILVIGGGATGIGIALDAASRGFRVALCEQSDFGKGTSSRSTKLIHGGVRYLEQGNVRLVREALHERGLLLKNAPHVVYPLPTIVPLYSRLDVPYYWTGLKAYDLLAGKRNIARSQYLTARQTTAAIPTLRQAGLRGGIRYYDAGFDDMRLLISLMQTAIDEGAACVNYLRIERLLHHGVKVAGVVAHDLETNTEIELKARVVINAAGPFSDAVRRMEDPQAAPRICPSQGTHVVLDRSYLPTDTAMIVPKTRDGRVIFAIPWHGHTLVGTTDTPLDQSPLEPVPLAAEVDFLLETVSGYLDRRPAHDDIRSVFAGIRPLVARAPKKGTSRIGRDHQVRVDASGMVSALGGKWTTYRQMAEDTVDRAIDVGELPQLACRTESLALRDGDAASIAAMTQSHPEYAEPLDQDSPFTLAAAVWAIRNEMARTVEDVLSRRMRLLLLNAQTARRAAPAVATLLANELGRDRAWIDAELASFEALAKHYLPGGVASV
jgi:glycerol-3-phosphate dehydrogenase